MVKSSKTHEIQRAFSCRCFIVHEVAVTHREEVKWAGKGLLVDKCLQSPFMPCSSRGLKAIDSSTEPDPAFLGCAFFSLSLIHPGYNRYSVRLSHAIKERVRGHSLTTQTLHMTFTTQRLKKSGHEELGLVSF